MDYNIDAYTEMWLQFCFPLYMWVVYYDHLKPLASFKIRWQKCCKCSCHITLLSYTKFLRLFTDVVSYTTITYPDGYTKSVWLHDGNIDYLQLNGKHVPLFIASVILPLLFIIPYTLVLLGIPGPYTPVLISITITCLPIENSLCTALNSVAS